MAILDLQAIQRILPHRYPMLLVDRIVELEPERIVGIKNVTGNEPFFAGHFPDFPVMPGVLIVEAMAQVAGVLVLKDPDRDQQKVVLPRLHRQAKFRSPVVPGDQLRIEMKVVKRKARSPSCTARPPSTAWWSPRPRSCASSPTESRGAPSSRANADPSHRHRRSLRPHRRVRRHRPLFDHRRRGRDRRRARA